MKTLVAVLALLVACTATADRYDVSGPTTTNNDDTCDVV